MSRSPQRGRGAVRRAARRVVVTVAGTALLVAGAAMLVLPGPGVVAALAGLAVLATEYTWAQRLVGRFQARAARVTGAMLADPRARRGLVGSSGLLTVLGTAVIVAGTRGTLGGGAAVMGVTLLIAGITGLALVLPSVRRRLGLALG